MQIVLRNEKHVAPIHRNRQRMTINHAVLRFQLKCYFTVAQILKIRIGRRLCIDAALVRKAVFIIKGNIRCFLVRIPEKDGSHTITGFIRHQDAVYVF